VFVRYAKWKSPRRSATTLTKTPYVSTFTGSAADHAPDSK
jgi:hypothetical protein